MKLRHAPLLLVREMSRHATHRALVADTLARVIQRADELSEFVAIYWAGGRQPLSAQVKKGLAAAFGQVRRVRAGQVRSGRRGSPARRAFSLARAPGGRSAGRAVEAPGENELATPDTWEVALSAAGHGEGADKKAVWERLLAERKLGALALLRNLRNLHTAGVSDELVTAALAELKTDRVLPFRFLAAARNAPQWEDALEAAMFRALEGRAGKFAGHTVLVVDVSGSMESAISGRSEMRRTDAAYGWPSCCGRWRKG